MTARAGGVRTRFLVALDRLILKIFFREVQVAGAENAPPTGPLVVVANHHNSLVDPMLVLGFVPRPSRFLAKSTLWRHPAAGLLVRLARAIPVYRRSDPGVDTTKNVETFSRCHQELAAGAVIALFPEGTSHSEPALLPLKTGVARIAFGAEQAHGPLGLAILPVGLNFENPETFRSRVLVQIGAPVAVPPPGERDESPAGEEARRTAVRELTARVEEGLRAVTLNYDSWRQAELLDCAAQVYSRSQSEAPRRADQADHFRLKKAFLSGFRRLRAASPSEVEPVLEATESYDGLLRRLELEDRHVAASYPRSLVTRFVGRKLWSLTLWRPLALVGLLLNWPPYRVVGWLTDSFDLVPNLRATWKVLLALALFPLYWLAAALAIGWSAGAIWGAAALALAPVAGWIALTYSESWAALRGESEAFITLKGRRAAARELARRRRRVLDEVTRLVSLHAERYPRPSE